MRKTLLALAMSLLSCGSLMALTPADKITPDANDKSYKSLVINMKDNSQFQINLGTDLKTSFANGLLAFVKGNEKLELTASEIDHWFYYGKVKDTTTSAVNNLQASAISMNWVGDVIEFSNLPEKSSLRIVDMAGRSLKNLNASGAASINIADLPAGAYVIIVNDKSFKITVK